MAASYSPDKFDIGIVNTDAINVGFMLAQKNGVPAYSVFDDEYLASQFFTDVPGYGALPSEKELAIRQDSWRAGFGLDVYDSDEPERYYNSRGMDMRFRGLGIAGMKPTPIALNYYPINNAGMEAWATNNSPLNWTAYGTDALNISKTDQAGQVYAGSWSCRLRGQLGSSIRWVKQTIPIDATKRGLIPIVNCYGLTDAASFLNLVLSDGYNTVSAIHTGNNAWHLLTTQMAINSLATEINVFAGLMSSLANNGYVDAFSITWPNVPVPRPIILNEGLEAWDSATAPAGYDTVFDSGESRGVFQQDIAANVHAGSYSARLYFNAAGGPNNYHAAVLSRPDWSNLYRGRQVIVNAWVQKGGVGANVTIDDGTNRTVKEAVANTNWQLVSTPHNIAWNATKLNIYVSDYMTSIATYNTHVDDLSIVLAGDNRVRKIAEFNDKLFFGAGPSLLRMNETNGSVVLANSLPENITALEPFTDNQLYAALNYGTIPYRYMNASEQLTIAGAGVNTFQFFKTVHSATPTMWGNDETNKIRSTATPSNAASWSGQTNVGSNYHSITDFLSRSAALYIMKEDMPYYLNSSGAVQNDLAPKLTALTSPTSGKNAHTDGDKIWIPVGSQSLIEEDGGALTWRTPALFSTNLTDYSGRIAAVTSDDMYVYVIINGNGVCHVLAGRNETIGSSTQWVWHPIAEIPIAACETAYVSSVYKKRLWIASNTGELFYVPLYADYGNPTNDTDRSFASNVEMQTPFLHANFKDTTKAFPKITALLGHPYNSSVFFNCYYKKLEDSAWTQVADLVGNADSRIATSFLPDDASNAHPFSTMMRFKFVVNTAYTDKTPMLLGYNVQGLLYPPKRTIISCIVRCAEEMTLRDGTRDSGSYAVLDATISEALKAKWPVTINDVDGQSKTVKFLPLPGVPRWTTVIDEKSRKPERWYSLMMQEVDLS